MKIAGRALAGLCLAAVVASAAEAAGRLQEPPKPIQPQPQTQTQTQGQGSQDRRFWWRDAALQKELALSARQVGKIDKIWDTNMQSIRVLWKEMEAVEAEFNRLIKENTAEERVIALQIDRVEALRSQINKSRHLMIYRIHQVLTPDQYRKLTEHLERRRKDRGRR